ncbi:hypothetical protein EDB81DRAFT_952274 [Dactylonectria macrodidyma]|uniref:Uncharacterized protein n=1 Tax=Dactylonectria macrodidyma TaxID=307937 RepID=A0A9P9IIN6_9HYPO|nr:hypothetical protein EDB81DRAFT_952274 [Dactylonectria macrodidyma]
MKTAPAAVLLLASTALATPADKGYVIRHADEVAPESMEDSGKMAVTGPVFEGGPDVTLYGTAQEVYAQILALNPHAFDNITDPVAVSSTTPVSKRGLLERRAWPIDCNPDYNPQEISWTACEENMNTLYALGNRQCSAPKNACRRPGCSRNCAFWLCDKSGKGITVTCRHIADDMQAIYDKCMVWYPDDWGGPSLKGRMWTACPPAFRTPWTFH